jgi:alpha-galactosidase
MPILLGDTRKVAESDKIKIKNWANWMEQMNQKHQIMKFRQDLPGFGEPQDGCWDGFQRINTETKSGGIVGIFRQGAAETTRTVTVKYLIPEAKYKIVSFPENKEINEMSGDDLSKKGFAVPIDNSFDGRLFEISKIE